MLRTCLVLTTLVALGGCSESGVQAVDKSQVISSESVEQVAFNTDGLPTVEFTVPSMHCEVMCAPKVRKTLAEQPGVADVSVDLETKTAVVAVEGDIFDAEKAIEALEMADFADAELKTDAS